MSSPREPFPSSMERIMPLSPGSARTVTFEAPITKIHFGSKYDRDEGGLTSWLYALTEGNEVWRARLDGGEDSPEAIATDASYRDIAADGRGNVYAAREDGHIMKHDGTPNQWTHIGYSAKSLLASSGKLYALTSGRDIEGVIWEYNGSPKDWTIIGRGATQLAATGDRLFATAFSHPKDEERFDAIWEYNGTPKSWTVIGPEAVDLSAGGGNLYAVGTDGALLAYRGEPNSWKTTTETADRVHASGFGWPILVTADGTMKIYNRRGSWYSFLYDMKKPGNPRIETVAAGGRRIGFVERSSTHVVRLVAGNTMDDTIGTESWDDDTA